MNLECIHCAGKGKCGRPVCPIRQKIFSQANKNKRFKKDFFGESPNVFIGNQGYPQVNVGVLAHDDANLMDNPREFVKKGLGMQDLVDIRSTLINAKKSTSVILNFDEDFGSAEVQIMNCLGENQHEYSQDLSAGPVEFIAPPSGLIKISKRK